MTTKLRSLSRFLLAVTVLLLAVSLAAVSPANAHPGHDDPWIIDPTPTAEPEPEPTSSIVVQPSSSTADSPASDVSAPDDVSNPFAPVDVEVDAAAPAAAVPEPTPEPTSPPPSASEPLTTTGLSLAFTGVEHTPQMLTGFWIVGCGCLLVAAGRIARRG